jgi:hypothetical protein
MMALSSIYRAIVGFKGCYATKISFGNLKIKTRPDVQPIARLKDLVDDEKTLGRYSEGNHRRFSPS